MSNEVNRVDTGSEKKTLILALIAGMCGDALLSWVTMSEVSFSIFPLIALVLSVQALYQEYLRNPVLRISARRIGLLFCRRFWPFSVRQSPVSRCGF